MVAQAVMAPHPAAPMVGWARVWPSSMVPGSLRSPSLPAPSVRRACRPWDRLDVALAAVASVGWFEAEPVSGAAALALRSSDPIARAEAIRVAEGGRGRLVTCGLWLARRRLVAAVVGPGEGARRVIRAALTDDARFGLIEYLAAAGAELVATEALARVDLLPVQAARRGLAVWTAGDAYVAALLRAAGVRDPARAAALLARLPAIPLLRGSIRRLTPPDERQMPLL
jgi:hypothetical protein